MKKLSSEVWKHSMSFMIDDNFDNNFLQSIEPLSRFIVANCDRFTSPEQLSSFLSQDGDYSALVKLKAVVSLIGLSEERLKRVVSLVRFRFFNEDFRSES